MELLCFGLNHKHAPIEIRERAVITISNLDEAANSLKFKTGATGCVLLSTCNRTEVYAEFLPGATVPPGAFTHWLNEWSGLTQTETEQIQCYKIPGQSAADHLFEVVSGMDSMVLGETEIFGQVKKAYQNALEAGLTGSGLNRLFQHAFRIGKYVRTHSRIQIGSTSVGGTAVELAEKIFGSLSECSVLVLGAGETSRLTAKALMSRGAKGLIVSNRNYDKAVVLATEMNGEALPFDNWHHRLHEVDIVISSTSAPHHVVKEADVRQWMRKRAGTPLFFIDIAVPRDIEPKVNDIDGVYLYDVDTLRSIAEKRVKDRETQLLECRTLIASQKEKLGYHPNSPLTLKHSATAL